MEYPLTITAIARRAEALWAGRPVVSRHAGWRAPSLDVWRDASPAAARLAAALHQLGVRPGDRVATLCWNHDRHFEAYFAVPLLGAVLHTLNLRLHPDELAYIASHAEDRVVLVDPSLLPLLEQLPRPHRHPPRDRRCRTAATAPPGCSTTSRCWPIAPDIDLSSASPASATRHRCATPPGTTGRPKAVVYSHRALVLHSMATAMAGSFAHQRGRHRPRRRPDVPRERLGPAVHRRAHRRGAGVSRRAPRRRRTLLDLCHSERVTFSAGVPTVWLGVLDALDAAPRGVEPLAPPHRDRRRGRARGAGARPRGAPRPPCHSWG